MTISACRTLRFAMAAVLVPALPTMAQSGGRLEEAKRLGLSYIKSYQFDKAAARLEEVWEQDQSDPTVAENLAIAYLNSSDREFQPALEGKARQLMQAALANGGHASFLAVHSHERFGWLQGRKSSNFCTGRLTIETGHIYFLSDSKEKPAEHSFDLKPEDILEFKTPGEAALSVKTRQKTFNLSPRSWNPRDVEMILALSREHITVK